MRFCRLRADVIHDSTKSLEECQDYCKERRVTHLIVLKDLDPGTVRVKSLERESAILKVTEKKMGTHEVVDYLLQKIQVSKLETNENVTWKSAGSLSSQSSFEMSNASNLTVNINAPASTGVFSSNTGSMPDFQITFFFEEEKKDKKVGSNTKRKYESQIYATVSGTLSSLNVKCKVEIIALDPSIQGSTIKTMAAYLDFEEEDKFETSLTQIVDKHQRSRKYLTKVFDYIHKLRIKQKGPVLLLYALKDDTFRLIL